MDVFGQCGCTVECGRRGDLSVEDKCASAFFCLRSPSDRDLRSKSAWCFSVDSRYSLLWFLNCVFNGNHARFGQHPWGGEPSIIFDNSSGSSCVRADSI